MRATVDKTRPQSPNQAPPACAFSTNASHWIAYEGCVACSTAVPVAMEKILFREEVESSCESHELKSRPRRWTRLLLIGCLGLIAAVLISLYESHNLNMHVSLLTNYSGLLHIIIVILGHSSFVGTTSSPPLAFPGSFSQWDDKTDLANITQNVQPIPCHSHNDYWRTVPFFEAISVGCTSVEADIWLKPGNDTDLFVGHKKGSLKTDPTLKELYLDPIIKILESRNATSNASSAGIFSTTPSQTLVLLLDFKMNGTQLMPYVQQHLEPLRQRNWLSYWNGTTFISRPITIVASGKAPTESYFDNPYHDIFFDAPLATFGSADTDSTTFWNTSNSYYASTNFAKAIGAPHLGRLSANQLETIRSQIKGAQRQGLKVRYWNTPAWPTSLKNYVWQVLLEEGVDVLNVDDLYAAAFLDWSWVRQSWFDG